MFNVIIEYVAGILFVTVLVLGGLLHLQTKRLDATKQEYATFRQDVREKGRAAEEVARVKTAEGERRRKQADDMHSFETGLLRADLERVRRANTARSYVPAAPAGASRPDLACFQRSELDAALRGFAGRALELAGEGSQATVDLNAAKRWAQQ